MAVIGRFIQVYLSMGLIAWGGLIVFAAYMSDPKRRPRLNKMLDKMCSILGKTPEEVEHVPDATILDFAMAFIRWPVMVGVMTEAIIATR